MPAFVRLRRMLLATLAASAASGCAVVKNPTSIDEARAAEAADVASGRLYSISPGDELDIVFFHTPQLNLTVPVRPDGYISVPLAHEVRAAGRTPEELRAQLIASFRQELAQPEIAVIVRTFAGQRVHVGGEVDNPGVYPLTGSMTVLDSLMGAGVFMRTARLEEILVIRRDPAGGPSSVIPVNVKKVLDGTDSSQNIALAPFDAVFVPTSTIADINTFIDLYIRKNIPVDFGLRIDVFR